MLNLKVNNGQNFSIEKENDTWIVNYEPVDLDIHSQPNGLISILYNGRSFTAIPESVDLKKKEVNLSINGQKYTVEVQEPIDQLLSSMGMDLKAMARLEPIKAPMPGMVLKVLVEPGQQIKKGDGLLILEAMKMENVLKAGADATVKSIKAIEKTAVEKGAVLIELE
jgi:biotin carboxyl carrier protein